MYHSNLKTDFPSISGRYMYNGHIHMINQYMDNTYSKSIEKPQNVLNNWQSICRFSREIEPGPGSIEPSLPAAGSGHNWRSRNSWSSRTSWRIINWCRDILKITYKDCEPRDPWTVHSICRKPESAEKTWSWKRWISEKYFRWSKWCLLVVGALAAQLDEGPAVGGVQGRGPGDQSTETFRFTPQPETLSAVPRSEVNGVPQRLYSVSCS